MKHHSIFRINHKQVINLLLGRGIYLFFVFATNRVSLLTQYFPTKPFFFRLPLAGLPICVLFFLQLLQSPQKALKGRNKVKLSTAIFFY